jgi:type II secretory pathway pseudopilin PulG
MSYKTEEKKNSKGFTLIELLLIIGLISVLAAFSAPVIIKTYDRQIALSTSDEIYSILKKAQSYSKFRRDNATWGVKLDSENNKYTIFKIPAGEVGYANRDADFDEDYDLYDVSYDYEPDVTDDLIIFERGTGIADSTSTLTISLPAASRDIVICENGIIDFGSSCNLLETAEFDGDDDYVDVEGNHTQGAIEMSVSAWIYWNEDTSMIYSEQVNGGTDSRISFFVRNDGRLRLGGRDDDSDSFTVFAETGDGAVPSGEWVHVVGVFDSVTNNHKVYISGNDSTVSSSDEEDGFDDTSTNNGFIGFDNTSSGSYFNGQIANVAIWNDVRTADQIADDYSRKYILTADPNLVGYWPLAGDFEDKKGDNDGTQSGGVTFTTDPSRPAPEQ